MCKYIKYTVVCGNVVNELQLVCQCVFNLLSMLVSCCLRRIRNKRKSENSECSRFSIRSSYLLWFPCLSLTFRCPVYGRLAKYFLLRFLIALTIDCNGFLVRPCPPKRVFFPVLVEDRVSATIKPFMEDIFKITQCEYQNMIPPYCLMAI